MAIQLKDRVAIVTGGALGIGRGTVLTFAKAGASVAIWDLAEDAGQDLLEYALLVSLIVIAAIGAVEMLGSTLKTVFWDVIASAKF
jgi:NAD(P)-dependent dehydrogenase (short-subunit alcohol dehydrogenase family)